MKLATFTLNNEERIGAVVDNEIVDASHWREIPKSMIEFLNLGETARQALQAAIDSGHHRVSLKDATLKAPVPKPSKYLAVSLNYADHIEETGREKPEFPTFFNKQVSCVIAPGNAIHRPKVSEKLDYEGELAIVIGMRCRHVPEDNAASVIAGYLAANDVSVRDWQMRSHTWTLGKSFDTHGPIGPWIVTSDEIGDPHDLDIKTWINEELRQDSNTRHLIFNCYRLVEYLSAVMTLEPGDIISTGTSSGVGVMMKPRGYMKPGDIVRVEIENIGVLENPVIDEPDDTVSF